MADLTIPINIPQTGQVNFTFTSPLVFDPNSKFPDTAFDNDGAISLASIKAKASREFAIGNNNQKIKFGANAGFLAAMGVYRKTGKLFDDLKDQGIQEKILELLQLKIADTDNLMVLRWGYEVGGDVNGQVAFSPVKINFGASGSASAISAVMRPVARTTSVKESIAKAIESWRVPRQIETVDNLDAKTYIITETTGKLGLSVGAEYGYSYNWSKEDLSVGALTGDLGLKIEMGIKAALNFDASGRYALVLGRETEERKLRAQVFRMKQNGWGAALDAGFSAQLNTSLPPADVNDFIKGIFNLHGLQVLKDFEKWALSDSSIEELLGQKLADEFVKTVTGLTPAQVTEKLKEAIKFWHELPHKINSLLYHFIEKKIDLTDLKNFLDEIIGWNQSDDKLTEFIEDKISGINFHSLPIGKWLSAIAEDGILTMLTNIKKERAALVDFAKKTKAILDGDTTENILKKLQEFIDAKLGLDKIENLDINDWLKKRLTDFIGKIPGVTELNKIKESIIKLRLRAQELYNKGLKALTQKYNLDLNYSFQKTTSKTALIDITIDFDKAGESKAQDYLKQILKGDFNELLTNDKIVGIKLNPAMLTHEIKRNSHLQINSPFGKINIDHINNSLASAQAIDGADGRLWLFSVSAEDIKKRSKNISKLAISAKIYEKAGVRVFEEDSYRARYQYILAKKNADHRFVERRMELGVNNYLLSKFPAGKNFSTYLTDIDKALDRVENDDLGNLIASLEVTLPGEALSVWTKLPNTFTDQFYKDMSRIIQQKLRDWIPVGFIQKPKQYEETDWIYPLFVYSALPVQTTSVSEGVYYWKFFDDILRINTIKNFETKQNLQTILDKYRPEIPSSQIAKYSNTDVILGKVAINKIPLVPIISRFLSLCALERKIIDGVVTTAKNYKKFTASNVIKDKIKFLADFGSELTETFNEDLGGEYAGKRLRPLGLQLMLEIGKRLDPALETIKPTAMLEMMVVKPELTFDTDKYLGGEFPESAKLVLEQRIVNVAG